uniref:Exportin-T n=1 Tax=Ditylum brightwellii TaxID=49249 RepID=A0A7S2EQA5_9STRA
MIKEDIYLRTLDAIHDEIVNTTTNSTRTTAPMMMMNDTNIKDVIRGLSVAFTNQITGESKVTPTLPVQDTVSARLISSLISLLQAYRPYCNEDESNNIQQQQQNNTTRLLLKMGQSIAVQSLNMLSKFISWVDLSLVLNDVILSYLWDCLHSAGIGGDDVGQEEEADGNTKLSIAASKCFNELLSRGMEGCGRKIDLLVRLNLFQELLACQEQDGGLTTEGRKRRGVDLKTVDATHIEAVIAVAELVNLAGIELLSEWDDNFLSCSSSNMDQVLLSTVSLLDQMMKSFFLCLSYDDIDVSGAVVPLALRLTVTMGKELDKCKAADNNQDDSNNIQFLSSLPFSAFNHLPRLLSTIYIQMRYPADFEFDFEEDEDAEEELYRAELRKFYRRVVSLYPDLCLSFLGNTLSSLSTPLSTTPTSDMEASLRLLYHHCEGIRPPPGTKTILRNETFRSLLVALHSSDVSHHSHREVLMLYYDVATRYSSLLKDHPQLMPSLLDSMSGVRGLQHPHPKVRSRSCYLLLKLVKDMGQNMRPYVETAVGGIQSLISNPTAFPIQPDDTLYLFETIGLLLGKTGLSVPDQRRYLTAVMTPHVQSINNVLQSPNLRRDPDEYGTILSSSVAALAYLSKGFTRQTPPEIQEVLFETVKICLAVLQSLPEHEAVRNKCMVLLQRMIQCLKEGVLPSMPSFLALLIEHCNAEDVLDVSQLLNQLCAKFGPIAVPALDAAALPFFAKMPFSGNHNFQQ